MNPRLVPLPASVTVTVTREEHHQDVLSAYRFPDVVVELAWCTILKGKYRGQRAVEVRLDGRRVGELTHAMTQRYGPVVDAVLAQGNQPGAHARIEFSERGYQIELLMPRPGEPIPAPVPVAPPLPTQVIPQPMPNHPSPKAKSSRKAKIWITVAAVVGFFAIVGALNQPDDKSAPNQQAAGLQVTATTTNDATTTAQAQVVAPAPETEETTETTTTTTSKTTTVKPKPPVVVHTTTKKRAPVTTTKRTTTKKKPPANSGCDPNYTGACVPIASDVDCAGGSGNGPAYVEGPVTVVGRDIYGLDNDHDGIGCES